MGDAADDLIADLGLQITVQKHSIYQLATLQMTGWRLTRMLRNAADPELLLQGATPHLIDEWQVEPELWNYVRHAVDDRQAKGQFILTGSAVPPTTRPVTRVPGGSSICACGR